jgi:hypothetical protein
MARPRKLSPSVVPAVRRAIAAGVSRKDVMKLFGIGRTTLWEALRGAEGMGHGVSEHLSGVSEHRGACAVTSRATSIADSPLSYPRTLDMGGLFSPSAPNPPPPPPPPPTVEDPAIEDARKKQLDVANKARGRAATLLTGGQGDTSEAPLGKATLLGA